MFFTSFENYQSIDFQNDLAFFIWRYELKVMTKRIVEGQIFPSPKGKLLSLGKFDLQLFFPSLFLAHTFKLKMKNHHVCVCVFWEFSDGIKKSNLDKFYPQ